MPKEILIPIKGFTNYLASNKGNIFSGNELMKASISKRGYRVLQLSKDGERFNFRVSRLICAAFHPNPENLPQVNHKDGDKLNDCAENLEWCTGSENVRHAYDTGLRKNGKGYTSPFSKFDADTIAAIRSSSDPYRKLSSIYNIGISTISLIKNNKRYEE